MRTLLDAVVEVIASGTAIGLVFCWPLLTPSGKEWRNNLKAKR